MKVRDICAEVGYSTHVVSHYFESKKELLLFTLKECAARQVERLKSVIARGDDLAACLESLLPLDEERLIDARVWMMFWAQTSDPEIAAVQRDFGVRWRRLLVGTMRLGKLFGPQIPRANQDFIAERVQMLVAGIGIHGALGVWSPALQKELLGAEVSSIMMFIDNNSGQAGKPRTKSVPTKESESDNKELVVENNRLRKALISALLQIETLSETQSSSLAMPLLKEGNGSRARAKRDDLA